MQILRVLAVCLTATTVYGLPSLNSEMRCSACQTIAKELDKALRIETPQMNVRLSGRMPGTGGRQREVKWKVSELRLIETFESLCQHRMEGYFLMGDKRWIKANSGKRNSALLKALTGGGSGNLDVGGAKSQECVVESHVMLCLLVHNDQRDAHTTILSISPSLSTHVTLQVPSRAPLLLRRPRRR